MRGLRAFAVGCLFCCLDGSTPASAQHHYLTKAEEQLISKSPFLEKDYVSPKRYKAYVNFGLDCSITAAIDHLESDLEKHVARPGKYRGRTFLIDDIDTLRVRLDEYPKVLKALDKWDAGAAANLGLLQRDFEQAKRIANGPETVVEKIRKAAPFLRDATAVSEKIAQAAGLAYSGGCGAGEEDSQRFSFVIAPQPKLAVYILEMDFDKCARLVDDPYDVGKCDVWDIMQPKDNLLSGRYKYRIVWNDGSIKDGRIYARGTEAKTLKIEK